MINADKNGELWCRTIVLNYGKKQQSHEQWQEFANSWDINIDQAKYLVEKCELVTSLGTDFLPKLRLNRKKGVAKTARNQYDKADI